MFKFKVIFPLAYPTGSPQVYFMPQQVFHPYVKIETGKLDTMNLGVDLADAKLLLFKIHQIFNDIAFLRPPSPDSCFNTDAAKTYAQDPGAFFQRVKESAIGFNTQ